MDPPKTILYVILKKCNFVIETTLNMRNSLTAIEARITLLLVAFNDSDKPILGLLCGVLIFYFS